MTLIITKSRLEVALGRFRLLVDEMEKVVRIRWVQGDSPSGEELRSIQKFLRYKRPDIVNDRVRTGWGLECVSARLAINDRANSQMPR